MEDLVFSTVLKEIKAAFVEPVSDPDLIQLLYDGIAIPANITNQNGDAIIVSKPSASAIMNRKRGGNALKVIRQHSIDEVVVNTIDDYFQRNVVHRLLPSAIDDLIYHLKSDIEADNIADDKKQELLGLAKKETLASFLARAYLYSLSRSNVLTEKASKSSKHASTIMSKDAKEYRKKPLDAIEFDDKVAGTERRYVDALLQVYGQLEGVTQFTQESLEEYPKHKRDFRDQRAYYYAAEAVRRGTRDIYNNREDQFIYLKDEIYEGVKEVWEEQYKDGKTRLRKVMSQACNTNVDGCWLTKETAWIGNPQRKGVCHFLVNEDRLNGWVRDDDG